VVLLAGLFFDALQVVDRVLARLVEQAQLEVACREAPGVFLYAASSASSRAATSVPLSIPFSRSISRTASTISWLIVPAPNGGEAAASAL
jgi:hypothetical protein